MEILLNTVQNKANAQKMTNYNLQEDANYWESMYL